MEQQQTTEGAVLVVLRQGSATPHGPEAAQAKEVVQGVAKWEITSSETLELYTSDHKLVATFRDWSFVKFLDSKK